MMRKIKCAKWRYSTTQNCDRALLEKSRHSRGSGVIMDRIPRSCIKLRYKDRREQINTLWPFYPSDLR